MCRVVTSDCTISDVIVYCLIVCSGKGLCYHGDVMGGVKWFNDKLLAMATTIDQHVVQGQMTRTIWVTLLSITVQ